MVSQLDDHLNIGIWGALEFLDQTFAVALVSLDAEIVGCDDLSELCLSSSDVFEDGGRGFEAKSDGVSKVGANGWVVKVEFVVDNIGIDSVADAVSWGAIHHAVFTHETCGAVVVDDELQRFVKPAICAVTVPIDVCSLFQSHRSRSIQRNDKG